MPPRVVPTVRRRRLAELLKQLRNQAGLSIEDVAAQFEWSASKLYRIERAAHGVSVSDARLLLDLYGVSSRHDEVLSLVRDAKERGWWHSYGDALPEPFAAYVGLEQDATSMAGYSNELVPGLLQTEEYARAVRRAYLHNDDEGTTERWLAVRSKRQARLTGDDRLTYWVVLNEAVLHRPVGGQEVMNAQLRHMIELSNLPNVTIQILPFAAGAHPAMDGSFTIVRFVDQAAPAIVYSEHPTSCLYLERSSDTARYTLIFDHVRARALDPDRSIGMVASLILQT
ncbi:MAG: helix-turn-helix domain-containing protein [Actinobacteria bacterium]|nr:helix-turn-helix domain-containing protein [Actinomycetota bacterium]